MSLLQEIRNKAKEKQRIVVLPESSDTRTIEAVNIILDNGIAKIILIAKEEIRKSIKSKDQSALTIIDPEKYPDLDKMAGEYYELRKHKGMTPEEARAAMLTDYLSFGAMLVKQDKAHGFVAGASHTTADVIRAALRCILIDKEIGVISGEFLIEIENCPYGEKGVFVYGDCGVNPEPNSRQLGGIAASSARLFKELTGKTPCVAFLSYSSKGSAEGPLVTKIREAVARAKEIAPDLLVDGEFQADSAIVPEVAKIKCPDSLVAGKANVLIFPDLNAGNISYKLTQRLANARAVGPLLSGFKRPCSDLSRGCDADDIVDAVAVTALRA